MLTICSTFLICLHWITRINGDIHDTVQSSLLCNYFSLIYFTLLTYKCSPMHSVWNIMDRSRSLLSLRIDRAMAQAVSRRPLTAETRLRSWVSPCGICGGQSGTGTGFFPSTSVFPCQFHSTDAPLHGKTKKKLIIFITGLHNKPQGCSACVVSAKGPFTTHTHTKQRLRIYGMWHRLLWQKFTVFRRCLLPPFLEVF
jgi:hypothetical protein